MTVYTIKKEDAPEFARQAKGYGILYAPIPVKKDDNTIDILVNCAGVMLLSAVRERKIEEWETMIDTNIKGVLHAVAAVLPIMREQRAGLIMNVISTAAYRVMEHSAIYSATKAAVRAFSEGLRKEETNHGIRGRPRKKL